jgi:2-(1,2-epoxy-1,2-dihydrophenyl)acetyl-CoA isomerase
MAYETIITEVDEQVGIITLNRPEALNGVNLVMREELFSAFQEMDKDERVKVIILNANGRGFCAGGDIKEQGAGFNALDGRARVRNLQRTLRQMVDMDKPIIAAVNGIAAGAGFNMALAADFIIAAEEAKFSQVFINIGFVTDFGGAYFLPRMIGLARAKEIVYSGRPIEAEEGFLMGFVARGVPLSELHEFTLKTAKAMSQKSALALALDKMLLNRSFDSDLGTILELEAFAQGVCFESDEHKEALRKLIESKKK